MRLALLQGMQSLESLINGILLLEMVFCSLEELMGAYRQSIPGVGNPLRSALLICLKQSSDIESSPGR